MASNHSEQAAQPAAAAAQPAAPTTDAFELTSDAAAIVSSTLSDFWDHNFGGTGSVAMASSKIIRTLLQNAVGSNPTAGAGTDTDTGNTSSHNHQHQSVRMGNPKIQKHVVSVPYALDLLGLAGFAVVQQGSGSSSSDNELYLVFQEETSVESQQQQRGLVQAICAGLEQKEAQTKEQQSSTSSHAGKLNSSSSHNKKQKTTPTTTPTTTTTTTTTLFLSDEERRIRQQKAHATRKKKAKDQAIAMIRWEEDKQDRKLATERREALWSAKVANDYAATTTTNSTTSTSTSMSSASNGSTMAGVTIHSATGNSNPKMPRAKPMAPAMAPDQQAEARVAAAKERYAKWKQETTSSGGGGNSVAAAAVAPLEDNSMDEGDGLPLDSNLSPTKANLEDDSMDESDNQRQKIPTPDEKDPVWDLFIEQNSRCAAAEGIRESSCYYNTRTKGGGLDNDALSIPTTCLKHLFRELDGLKDSLPAFAKASIWVRFDEETPQYMRVLMAAPLPGPTPYAGGTFLFDMYIPANYPHVPPKVSIVTTGSGKVRFGPNLYADGKVCLSLLGTWSGPKWNPAHSSLYQVLISMQGLILGVEHPYYLEPGHGAWEGTVKEGDFTQTGHTLKDSTPVQEEIGVPIKVVLYEDELRVASVKYAMLDPLSYCTTHTTLLVGDTSKRKSLWHAFVPILRAHFTTNRTAIVAEVRKWMSDNSFGRNRNAAGKKKFTIDQLQSLLPKLEHRLSMIKIATATATTATTASVPSIAIAAKPASGSNQYDNGDTVAVDMEEDSKPAAKRSPAKLKQGDMDDDDEDTGMVVDMKVPAVGSKAPAMDCVEQKRQAMQEAAAGGDYVLAGQLQEEITRIDTLRASMETAANDGDFIRAGRLQAQLKALTSSKMNTAVKSKTASAAHASHQEEEDEDEDDEDEDMMDEDDDDDDEEEDDDEFDSDDDDDMPMAGAGGHHLPQGLGKNVFAPSGHKSKMSSRNHAWGSGSALAATSAATDSTGSSPAAKSAKMPAIAKRIIPMDQLCRLRIRLPTDKSIVEDFHKHDSLSAVYRRLEDLVSPDGSAAAAAAGAVAPPQVRVTNAGSGGGAFAFSQPRSSAGFTLLLTRPKREFSLEMHGTKTLEDLNLSPSATLTIMKCSDRGVMHRGELESRLRAAQGDAIDVEGLTYEGLIELTERLGAASVPGAEGSPFFSLSRDDLNTNSEMFSPAAYLAELKKGTMDDHDESKIENDCRCPICLGEYDSTDTTESLRKLTNCNHIFHTGCLETWLGTKSSCPLCKMSVCPDEEITG